MYGLKTEAAFDSAHFLADYYGKCENLHGHRWRVVVELAQEELQTEGTMRDMVLDFGVFKKAVRALADELDHTFLIEEGSLKPETMRALEEERRGHAQTRDDGCTRVGRFQADGAAVPHNRRKPRALHLQRARETGLPRRRGRVRRDPQQPCVLARVAAQTATSPAFGHPAARADPDVDPSRGKMCPARDYT